MDAWATGYLRTWQSDFADEPDAEIAFHFIESVLYELRRLSQEGPANREAIHETVSNSIIAAMTSLPDPEIGVEDIQGVLFEAAISSPSDPFSLANITRQLIDNLPAPWNEELEKGIAFNTRERWNGPDKPAAGTGTTKYIGKWVSLNSFAAHLTALNASLGHYGVWTLNRAFSPNTGGYREDERLYHVPAAAAWIDILGGEIYRWSVQGDIPGEKWEQWKRGFEAVSQSSEAFEPGAREKAQIAFNRMREMEKPSGGEIQ
ncbi:uncharacterized protein BO97DRAFT_454024 [Aspergillus homomorphus CBS 101889]|uniref:Uncharacterized protein n=1 Tax=Aspergillus homomorphus (strain CBS 101889) TaxID=1450537 RepID=A0A395HU91_ASPHC|nr:hypothetical protein BO97DRAFT_454024 [Aspergillus homomorphus CBS 101889]RAL11502.1 hypothetical protein BO97DRAFT_454024 [Aspergillus homomorphus CBS 101889]